jgi:hypothetical protein
MPRQFIKEHDAKKEEEKNKADGAEENQFISHKHTIVLSVVLFDDKRPKR